ncbi:hypothetical protein QBC34DRAFT_429654 [Podospora aff. communis PSN243]|uniref:Ecp2 effector protein domain-containing protein n=1 Tax=Podospora aff. communis PSN243 TaxID=3040156 RepID=A0AAV9G8K2_9PEZI|nr:hypothetical protein QBC34DRAFT_429654 [Podospora aff. communis PSN243]
MKLFTLISAVVYGATLATASPVINLEAVTGAEASAELSKRADPRGRLSAFLQTGLPNPTCSGTPDFVWVNPGFNQCLNFIDRNNNIAAVHQLLWNGNNCELYLYNNRNCQNDFAHANGANICAVSRGVPNRAMLSFKLVC